MLMIDPGQVAVTVEDGVVTLTGELGIRAEAVLAVRFVERLEGVVRVIDQLGYDVDERLADSRVAPLS
jgi:osmotically-inducible protein OsmY